MIFLQIYFSALTSHHSTSCVHIWMKLQSSSDQNLSAYVTRIPQTMTTTTQALGIDCICEGIHTTKTLPIDFLYKITAHLTPFSRYKATGCLKFGIILKIGTITLLQTWTNHMMKAIFSRYRALKRCSFKRVLANLEMFLDIGNARVPKKPH